MKPIALVQRVLADYRDGKMTLSQIARKYRVSKESAIGWAHSAHLPPRRRGQPKLVQPTRRQKQILELAEICTFETVARRFGITKQRVSQIAKRWGVSRKNELSRTINHNRPEPQGTFSEGSSSPFSHSPVPARDFARSSHRAPWQR